MSIKGNRGEWSEFYCLLKILCDRRVWSADENLELKKGRLYPVKKVIWGMNEHETLYEFAEKENKVLVLKNKEIIDEIDTNGIKKKLPELRESIKNLPSGNGAHELPVAYPLMRLIHSDRVTGNPGGKSDIMLMIYNSHMGTDTKVGFSVKSQLGADPSLLNAAKTTNFSYIVNFPKALPLAMIQELNNKGPKKLVNAILELGGALHFNQVCNAVFYGNLIAVDSLMPIIMSELVFAYFATRGKPGMENLTRIAVESPNLLQKLDGALDYSILKKKIQDLLVASALGMEPGTKWEGGLDAHGGCIIVREDGELACYHYDDMNKLKEYLFNNTKLDTGSTGKHDFAFLAPLPDGTYEMKLNLQIRFKN